MTGENDTAGPELEGINGRMVRLFRTVTLIWAAIISWLAFRPSASVESGLPWDKANHAMAFILLTFLTGRGWPNMRTPTLVVIMLAAGVGIELVQGLPAIGRDADVWDVVADAVGIAVGLALLKAASRPPAPLTE